MICNKRLHSYECCKLLSLIGLVFAGQGGEVAAHDQHPARALHPGAAGRHAAVPAPDEPLQG